MALHCGWELQDLDRDQFYAQGSEKEFTIGSSPSASFHRSYLQVLLPCDWLFEAGAASIYHCQSKSYYDCILALANMGAATDLNNLKPNLPSAEYKQLVKKRQESCKTVGSGSKQTAFDPPEETEDDANLLWLPQQQNTMQNEQQTSKSLKSRKKRCVGEQAATASSAAKDALEVSDSDRECDYGQDERTAMRQKAALPSSSVECSGKLTQAVAAASQLLAEVQAAKANKRKQKNKDEQKTDKEEPDSSQKKRSRMVPVKTETVEEAAPNMPHDIANAENAEIEFIKSSSEDEDAPLGGRDLFGFNIEIPAENPSMESTGPQPPALAEVSAAAAAASGPVFSSSPTSAPSSALPEQQPPSEEFAEFAPTAATSSSSPSVAAVPRETLARNIGSDHAPADSANHQDRLQQQRPEPQEPSSVFNMSTIWLGNIPLVKRSDKHTEPWIAESVGNVMQGRLLR